MWTDRLSLFRRKEPMPTREELFAQEHEIRRQINALDHDKRLAAARAVVGRYFKSQHEDEYFAVLGVVDEAKEHPGVEVIRFVLRPHYHGQVEVQRDRDYSAGYFVEYRTEIPRAEWEAAWKQMIGVLSAYFAASYFEDAVPHVD